MEPLVSIIIPCFNAEEFICDAINSALQQTYPAVEVIVIDDGSTDGSLDIIKSSGNRIRWKTGPNRGGNAARNRGIELARGDLIQFLDADDLLHRDKLEIQVPIAMQDDQVITYCDYEYRDLRTSELIHVHSKPNGYKNSLQFVLNEERLTISAPLHWRKTLLGVGGFREHLRCGQEYDLHLRLVAQGLSFKHVDRTLFTVRRRGGSVSSDYCKVLLQHEEILSNLVQLMRQDKRLSPKHARAIAGKFASNARMLLRFGQGKIARRYFAEARKLDAQGGIDIAYSRGARICRAAVGARMTEWLVCLSRKFRKPFRNNDREIGVA
jgi:glycosyltransferase involved in cell wall biosynthesis